MFYNMYLSFHFANPNIYTTFAGVNPRDMKKTMLLLALCAMFVGCEDKNGVAYSDYPIAGKSYKTEGVGSYYDIYVFAINGTCKADGYIDDRFIGSISDYWYWMEGDSIFIDVEPKRNFKYKRGCYHTTYITIDNQKASMVVN